MLELPRYGRPKAAVPPAPSGRIPRVTRLMALAIKFQAMLDRRELRDYADLARLGYGSRARITQVMNLLLLAPDIQEGILFLPQCLVRSNAATERHLRKLVGVVDWAAQRRLCATPAACVERERIITRHHNLQRLLECRPVVIPFAERIEFPSSHVQYRREQERFLGLIEASALLHQQQRLRDGQHLVADKRDFELAAALTAPFLGAREGLARHSALLLAALSAAKLATFTMEDVTALQPGRTRYAYRAALHELLDLEYLASPRAGRGRLREYRLLTGQTASTPPLGIRLRAVGELAKVGETTTANFTSRAVSS